MINLEVDKIRFATYEARQSLYKDLCSRIPYKPKVKTFLVTTDKVVETPTLKSLTASNTETIGIWAEGGDLRYIYIPYLYPLKSMKLKQYEEFIRISGWSGDFDDMKCGKFSCTGCVELNNLYDTIDWLNKNYFDYRGLIERGLAVDCTNLNVYNKGNKYLV